MKSDSWLFIIVRSLDRVRNFRVEKRTLIILGCGGIIFAAAFAFFAYEYFSLLHGHSLQRAEIGQLKTQIALLEQKLQKASEEKIASKPIPCLVTIENLKVVQRAKRGGFSVRFRLINLAPQGSPISGTLSMVAKNEALSIPVFRVVPEMRLDKGIPQEPEKGARFEVKGEKFVEAFFNGPSKEIFKTLTIYVFSPEGKLIMQRSVEIPER